VLIKCYLCTARFDHSISACNGSAAILVKSTGMLILRFAALYGFWIILSGRFEVKYLIMGAVSAFIVLYLTQDLAQPDGPKQVRGVPRDYSVVSGIGNFILYFFWLMWSVAQSNLQVAYIVLHPKLPIQPGLLRLRTKLRNRTGHIILANSITLTPGTITIDFDDGDYSVHALVPEAAQSLLDAKMQSKLERIFGEREEAETDIRWIDKPGD
jgi:multicomponent Na+:H+ antiporter subunit E